MKTVLRIQLIMLLTLVNAFSQTMSDRVSGYLYANYMFKTSLCASQVSKPSAATSGNINGLEGKLITLEGKYKGDKGVYVYTRNFVYFFNLKSINIDYNKNIILNLPKNEKMNFSIVWNSNFGEVELLNNESKQNKMDLITPITTLIYSAELIKLLDNEMLETYKSLHAADHGYWDHVGNHNLTADDSGYLNYDEKCTSYLLPNSQKKLSVYINTLSDSQEENTSTLSINN